MGNAIDRLAFSAIRTMESVLSVRQLYRALAPIARLRAAFKRTARSAALPAWLAELPPRAFRDFRTGAYLGRALQCFPERLASAKWSGRCRWIGFDRLQQLRENGRPVVLAFWHFGSYQLLPFWLRAADLPVAVFLGTTSASRSRFRGVHRRVAPFVQQPTAFFRDQLRGASEFLARGNPLLISIDTPSRKTLDVPLRDGWEFRMSTGAFRLARHCRAQVVPCSIVDEERWRFRIEIGRAVPHEQVAERASWPRAARHLLGELLVHVEAHPEQCSRTLLRGFARSRAANRAVTAGARTP